MAHWRERLNVREFHIEDLNPTIDEKRIEDLCREIESARLDVTWKIVAGTKLEEGLKRTIEWYESAVK